MVMTEAEIVADYKAAKQKAKQIGILADLNECKRAAIVDILKRHGQELPGYYNKQQKQEAPEEPKPRMEEPPIQGGCWEEPPQPGPIRIDALALREIRNAIDELRNEYCDLIDCVNKIDGILALYESIEKEATR